MHGADICLHCAAQGLARFGECATNSLLQAHPSKLGSNPSSVLPDLDYLNVELPL